MTRILYLCLDYKSSFFRTYKFNVCCVFSYLSWPYPTVLEFSLFEKFGVIADKILRIYLIRSAWKRLFRGLFEVGPPFTKKLYLLCWLLLYMHGKYIGNTTIRFYRMRQFRRSGIHLCRNWVCLVICACLFLRVLLGSLFLSCNNWN